MIAILIFGLLAAAAFRWAFKQERSRGGLQRFEKQHSEKQNRASLAAVVAKLRLPKALRGMLSQAALTEAAGGPKEGELAALWAACGAFGTAIGWSFAALPGGLLGLTAGLAAPVAALALRRGERNRRLAEGLPDFLESVARSLRSGSSLPQAALETIEGPPALSWPLSEELAEVRSGIAAGAPFQQVLEDWRDRRQLRAVALAVAAMSLGAGVGGERARSIDGVAHTLREHQALHQELAVSAAQARISAVVVAGLPLMFLLLAGAVGGQSGQFLLGTSLGIACLIGGVALNCAGAWWMRRIVRQVPV